jgi:hypothetical protein
MIGAQNRPRPQQGALIVMKHVLTLLAVGLALTGCAATVQKSGQSAPTPVGAEAGKSIVLNMTGSTVATTASDWSEFKGFWRDACAQEAAAGGAVFSMQDGEPKPTGAAGTLVVVDIADYRYVSTSARIWLGSMMGNSYINARVTFRDLKSGDVRTSETYDTKSSAWQGVYTATTFKQVRAMCHEIVGEVVR